MAQKINVQGLPVFSLAEQLKTDEDIAIYMGVVWSDDGSSEIAHALGIVADARAMSSFKKTATRTCLDNKE